MKKVDDFVNKHCEVAVHTFLYYDPMSRDGKMNWTYKEPDRFLEEGDVNVEYRCSYNGGFASESEEEMIRFAKGFVRIR